MNLSAAIHQYLKCTVENTAQYMVYGLRVILALFEGQVAQYVAIERPIRDRGLFPK